MFDDNDHHSAAHDERTTVAKLIEAGNSKQATLIFRGLVMLGFAVLTGIGIPVLNNAGNLLIELSRKVDQNPLKLDLLKADITILRSDISGRQTASDNRQTEQAAAIQRLTADQANALQAINIRLAELTKEFNQLQVQYAVLNSQLQTLLDSNKTTPAPPRVR